MPTDEPRAFLHFTPLLPGNFPMYVDRGDGWLLFVVDPSVWSCDATQFLVDEMSPREQNLYRRAYGAGDCGTPVPDWWLREEPVPAWIPGSLRVPSYNLPERRVGCPIDREAYDILNEREPRRSPR